MQFVLIISLGLLTLLSISLQRTYKSIPLKELKKRARTGDVFAEGLHRAVAYGSSLHAVLWVIVIISSASFFVAVSKILPVVVALLVCAGTVWLGYLWLPAKRASRVGLGVARFCAPGLAKLMSYLHPVVDRLHGFLRRHYPLSIHTGVYDKYDLIELLQHQQMQSDNRINLFELEVAVRGLTFGDRLVREILVPRRVVKAVANADAIGPILMSELHASGHSRFPVHEVGSNNNIVGTLYLRDLVDAKEGGLVADTMRKRVCYIHEEQTLLEALQAILKTKHHLFIVVNSFEEYVGILTIEDVLEQIVGVPILDEFDRYDDMRAVAQTFAAREHLKHKNNHDTEANT